MKKRVALAVGILALSVASAVQAAVLYTNNVQTGFRYTPGGGTVVDNRRVAFDDVPIPNALLGTNTAINVTRVTVGIRQLAGAPATAVDLFWATLTTGTTAPDTELDSPGTLFGSVNLPAAAAAVTSLVTLGDGINTMFTAPLNSTLLTGFGTMAIGVRLSDTGGLNGWRLTNGPSANADVFWQYDPGTTGQPNPEALFNFGGAPTNPAATFYIVLEGTPVPEPGTITLLIGGVALLMRRRFAR